MIGIIDYGSGNFSSVCNAFEILRKEILVVNHGKQINKCSHIVLPGVGSFHSVMNKLEKIKIREDLHWGIREKKIPFLGICVGMQILADFGYEFGEHKGLGYIPGIVKKLSVDKDNLPLPHIGWNNLSNMNNSPLFDNIEKDANFYFVHSYHFKINKNIKTVDSFYGEKFVAAVSFEYIHGVQFHPEKSQLFGLKVLENFTKL